LGHEYLKICQRKRESPQQRFVKQINLACSAIVRDIRVWGLGPLVAQNRGRYKRERGVEEEKER
jgi:hypothetical protein